MNQPLFAYGTLQVPSIMQQVLGSQLDVVADTAHLHGYRCTLVQKQQYPGIQPEPSGTVTGQLLAAPTAEQLQLLDQYEGELYQRRLITVSTALQQSEQSAWCYLIKPEYCSLLSEQPWSLQHFIQHQLANYQPD